MEFRQLYYFVKVADEGNYTRASEKLHVSQPSLSKAIQALERSLGVTLIVRTSRSFQLTYMGEQLYEKGREVVRLYEELSAQMSDLPGRASGFLRCGIPPVLSTLLAPYLLIDFQRRYPDIRVETPEAGSKVIGRRLLSDKLDMAGNATGNDQFFYQKNILDWTIDRDDNTMYTNTGAINFLEHPATNPALFWHQELVFDRLLNADASLNPTDGLLAESYEVSEDGTVFTFTIREGVVWHDGEPFTADDVKWTFEYYPTVPGANAVMTDVINDLKSITVDGNTVVFEFNNPQPNALTVFSQWPVLPKHCLENVTPENFAADIFWQNPIGTGPFKVETVKLGEYTTLVRNEDYFLTGTGNIERIYMYPSNDAGDTNLITNAQAGNIDYAFCKDSAQVQQLEDLDGYNVEAVNVTFPRYIFLNMFERTAE